MVPPCPPGEESLRNRNAGSRGWAFLRSPPFAIRATSYPRAGASEALAQVTRAVLAFGAAAAVATLPTTARIEAGTTAGAGAGAGVEKGGEETIVAGVAVAAGIGTGGGKDLRGTEGKAVGGGTGGITGGGIEIGGADGETRAGAGVAAERGTETAAMEGRLSGIEIAAEVGVGAGTCTEAAESEVGRDRGLGA